MKYFSGMKDESASFEIVRKLVVYLGGSLDVLAGISASASTDDEAFTEAESIAIMKWAGSEISRAHKTIIAGLEARLSEKDFHYLIDGLFRAIMPGRLVSVHCMNLPAMKSRDGFIGIKDFRGDIIRAFTAGGFIFHSEVTIWKNPVTEMQRTKALGLLHKQM